MLDIYDWILSPEIRDYLRENHRLSVQEKIEIICGGWHSVEEKYTALRELLGEAESDMDKEEIQSLCRLFEWVFEELRRKRPGQIFTYDECSSIRAVSLSDALSHRFCGVERMFRTYEELWDYCGTDLYYEAYVEKWAVVNGEMKEIIGLHLCSDDDGRAFIKDFAPKYLEYCVKMKGMEAMGISMDAMTDYHGDRKSRLPLPFQSGDLVRLDIPDTDFQIYGVLYIWESCERFMQMAYIEDCRLKHFNMAYRDIDSTPGWRVIDWMHPAQPSELPEGQELLVELSSYVRRAGKDPQVDKLLCDRVFYRTSKPIVSGSHITLDELLKMEETDGTK